MAQYNFGVGQMFYTPPGANQTPVQVGTLKDISLDISRDVKELYGALAFPEDVALGKGKITGKAKSGRIFGSMINALIAGSTIATGQNGAANNEIATIPTTPFQITVTNSATWQADGGIYDYTAGIWMTRVASAPATGQYSVAAGVYTYAAADVGHQVGSYYTYTIATGKTVSLSNPLMGAATVYTVNVFNTYRGKQKGFKLWAVVFPKISWDDKQDDFTEWNLEFQGFSDTATNKVIDHYSAE